MRIKLSIGIAGIGLCLAGTAVPVVAHHAFSAEFDANKPIELTGTVTKMEGTNPTERRATTAAFHSWLTLNVSMSSQFALIRRTVGLSHFGLRKRSHANSDIRRA